MDLDNCLNADGTVKDWARRLLLRFGNTYMEVSPSGRGIRIFFKAKLAKGTKIEFTIDGEKCAVEAHSQGRYFTVTGRCWPKAPLGITAHPQADIEMALVPAAELTQPGPAAEAAAPSDTATITEGGRHDALKKMGVKLRIAGLDATMIEAALLAFNAKHCSPPKPEDEVRDIVKWGAEHPFDGTVDPATLPKLVGINGEAIYSMDVKEVDRWWRDSFGRVARSFMRGQGRKKLAYAPGRSRSGHGIGHRGPPARLQTGPSSVPYP